VRRLLADLEGSAVGAVPTGPAVERSAEPVDQRATLNSGTTVRREPFGGLVYSFETRRLRVVRSRPAIEVLIRAGAGESLDAVGAWLVEAGYASDLDAARLFVNATVDQFQKLGVMSWTTS
jgi:putative mycofactocin binding protein MftB